MSVSVVQHVSALTNVDGCVYASGGTCQCSDNCGWVCLEHVSSLTIVDGCAKHVSAMTTMDGCGCVPGRK